MTEEAKKTEQQQIFKTIPVNIIDTEGQMVRTEMDEDHVAELALSIAKRGLLQPIVVSPKPDGRYQLQAGAHRLAAVQRLRWTEIPANIRGTPLKDTKTTAVIENLQRRQLTVAEEILAVERLYHVDKMSVNEIADTLSKSRDWVNRRLMVKSLPDWLVDDVMEGVMPLSHAEVIAEIKDESTARMVANYAVQQRLTLRATKDMAIWYRDLAPQADGALPPMEPQPAAVPATAPRRCDACGAPVGIGNLRVVWICKDGCEVHEHEQLPNG